MTRKDMITGSMLKAFETVPDLYLILSPELHILSASNAYLAATFTRREEITGKYVFDVFPENPATPEIKPANTLYASLQEVKATGKPHQMALQRYDVPASWHTAGGFIEKYWQPLNTPVLDEEGNLLYIIHKVSDVTDQVHDQRQAKTSMAREQAALTEADLQRNKIHDLFMQAPALIASVQGPDYVFDMVNPLYQQLFPGRPLLGKPLLEAVPEFKGQPFMEILDKIYKTGEMFTGHEIPVLLNQPDQGQTETRYYNFIYQAMRSAAGKVDGVIIFAYDVTENVHMRLQLLQLNQKLEDQVTLRTAELAKARATAEAERNKLFHLFMQAPALICIFEGPRHIFRLVNPLYQQLVGNRPILGKPIAEAMPELEGQPIFPLLDKVYQTGEPFYAHEMMVQLDHNNQGKLGENYYNFVYQPTRNLEGNIDGILVFAYEVTQLVLARKQAEQSEKQLHILNEKLNSTNQQLSTAKEALEKLNSELELHVEERTQALLQARAEIERQRKRLENFFMQAPAAICVLDGPAMVFELVNTFYQQLFPGRVLLGKPILEALPEIKDQLVHAILENVYQTGESVEGKELLIPLASETNGKVRDEYFNFIYQARQNEYGQTDGIFVFAYQVTEQVLARKRVEESAQQLRLITDSLPVLIGYLDREEKYRFANQAYQSWFHQPPERLLGRSVREIVGEEAYQGIKIYIDRALAGEKLNFEVRMPYRENFIKHIHTSYVPDIQEGEVAGFYTLVTDITDQVMARQKVEESEKRFRTLLESIPQITWTAQPDGHLDYFSQQWYEYSNYTYEQSIGQGWVSAIHPDDLPALSGHWNQSLVSGGFYQIEARVRRADGMYRWFLIRALPLRNAQGTITQWIGTCTDMEDQKQWEQQLLESGEYFRMMADNAPVMIWITRPDGYCTYLNKPWYDYTGQTEEEAAGMGWTQATHPDDASMTSKIFMEANARQSIFRLNYRLRGKDGTYRWFTDVGLPRFSQSGEYEGYVGAVLDIHEQKLAEEALHTSTQKLAIANKELEAANQEIQASNRELSVTNQQLIYMNADLDNFIYTASHDLKAPIVNIEGLMKILVRHLSQESLKNERTQVTIGLIQDSIERFKRTISNLTEVVKLQKEHNQPATWVDIHQLLKEVQLDLAADMAEAKANLHADVSLCPVIQFSKKNLRSILYNLLSNAIKYRSPDRNLQIHIYCEQTEEYQLLVVQDNGLGMNLSGEQKLFSMFRRMHTHVEGSGIGLYMVKKIIDNAGGRIEVESKVGIGSTFRVYFQKKN